jgi:hypothetical protein
MSMSERLILSSNDRILLFILEDFTDSSTIRRFEEVEFLLNLVTGKSFKFQREIYDIELYDSRPLLQSKITRLNTTSRLIF